MSTSEAAGRLSDAGGFGALIIGEIWVPEYSFHDGITQSRDGFQGMLGVAPRNMGERVTCLHRPKPASDMLFSLPRGCHFHKIQQSS